MDDFKSQLPLNAFTVDVEDYFQVSAFERDIRRESWDGYSHRVVRNTERILELLDRVGVKGTFYVLGWTADRFPHLVRDIAAAGHELGSHSYWHRLVYEMTPESFRQDLRESRRAIEAASGVRVTTYRAPSFSITSRSTWALDILIDEGYTVDSSVFPIIHDRYGIPGARPDIHPIERSGGTIWEFPPSIVKLGLWNLPVSGGGYFRLYPYALTASCLQTINRTRPFMFYIHPWEVDPEQEKLSVGSRLSRFRHYVNLKSTYEKLEKILRNFAFARVQDVMSRVGCRQGERPFQTVG